MKLKDKIKHCAKFAVIAFVACGIIYIVSQYFGLIGDVQAQFSPLNAKKEVVVEVIEPEKTVREHICAATNGENCDVIYNLCKKESGKFENTKEPCQQYAVNGNKNGTYDYSWLQVNDVHIIGRWASKGKGTITMECVYDLYCVSRWANEKIKAGQGNLWVA